MSELLRKQKLVKLFKSIDFILLLLVVILFFLELFEIKETNYLFPLTCIIIYTVRKISDRLCTCKRCGHKMSHKEFMEIDNLICPNGQDHEII